MAGLPRYENHFKRVIQRRWPAGSIFNFAKTVRFIPDSLRQKSDGSASKNIGILGKREGNLPGW